MLTTFPLNFKEFLKRIIPDSILNWYHFVLAYLGAFLYGFPSKKIIVIGVTGTKGKTTTCNLIAHILNYCGLKTGMATTVNFCLGNKEWINETKQTMLGRFRLQKLLRQMVNEGCKYAVIETSSEGILQHRHRGIDYNIAVFTNLTPEHIERHGTFENYRAAKVELFKKVAKKKDGVGIYNLDDKNSEYFLETLIKNRYGYCIKCENMGYRGAMLENRYHISDVETSVSGSRFKFADQEFEIPLIGEFNIYNAAAAICVGLSQNIAISKIKEALRQPKPIPGRMEIINEDQNFTAIVDYSYEPASLENALKTLKLFKPNKIITLIGSAGGGRDKWRRPVMGEIADKYADIVIVTTDDPYDEKPKEIADQVLKGVLKNPKRKLKVNVFKIIDRRKAIKKAVELAEDSDVILFAGKGGEKWMNVARGKKIPWDETEIVRATIREKQKNKINAKK